MADRIGRLRNFMEEALNWLPHNAPVAQSLIREALTEDDIAAAEESKVTERGPPMGQPTLAGYDPRPPMGQPRPFDT